MYNVYVNVLCECVYQSFTLSVPCERSRMFVSKIFKTNFKQEKYLSLNNFEERKKISQFRISAHKLETEQDRYTIPKTPVKSRICKQCDLNLVENEIHFLVICPKYEHLRSKLYNKINNKNFNNLSDFNKFNWLMSMEDIRLTRELAVYLINCFPARTR